jgi:hypothetical protein
LVLGRPTLTGGAATSCVGFVAVWHKKSPPPVLARNVANSAVLSLFGFLALLLVLMAPSLCAAATSVGMVTKVENQAHVGDVAAAVGSIVHINDVLKTGPTARLEVTFRDQTTLTLGENARIAVDKYVFNPEASTGELLLSSTKGAFRMATGRLAEMRNRQINVSTPAAALAVRGTDWWWGPMKGKMGVLMVSNSKVVVKNEKGGECGCHRHTDEPSCRDDSQNYCVWNRNNRSCNCCEVELTGKHQGTYVEPGKCPEEARTWSEAEVQSALSSVQFGLAAGSAIPAVVGAIVGVAIVVDQITQPEVPTTPMPASP